uniref:Putative poly-A polymerase domain containing protein n=1 Tax=viral metagenome TaxID=1070528 RepID=A0A6H1ZB36_9ZZZZ
MEPKEIVRTLEISGYEAYFIGGFVRDVLCQKNPKDIDIVTSARPDDINRIFPFLCHIRGVGKSFGVMLVDDTEVATYRKDVYGGDKPIEYAMTLEEDTQRRDFTINALAMDSNGKIKDFHNGVSDLNNKIIRFIGDPNQRIYEDPNRMLRACRFVAQLDFNLHDSTLCAIRNNSRLMSGVAPERIRKELMTVLENVQNSSKFFTATFQSDILKYIFKSMAKAIGLSQNKYHLESLFTHLMRAGDAIPTRKPLVKLAAYLHDTGKSYTKIFDSEKNDYTFLRHEQTGEKIVAKELTKLKFSNDEIQTVSKLVGLHMRSSMFGGKAVRKIMRKLDEYGLDYKDYLRMKFADKKAKYPFNPMPLAIAKKMVGGFYKVLDNNEPFSIRHLEVNGHDVMGILGIKPSPKVGEVLLKLFNRVLENPELNKRDILLKLIVDFG